MSTQFQFSEKYQIYFDCRKFYLKEKMNVVYSWAAIATVILRPILNGVLLHLQSPHEATLFGFELLSVQWVPEEACEMLPCKFFMKTGIFLLTIWIWTFGVNATGVCVVGIQGCCTMVLRHNMERFLVYWNQEHDPTCQKVSMYRQLQIFTCLHNEIMQGMVMAIIIFTPSTLLSSAVTTIITTPFDSGKVGLFAICDLAAIDCTFLLMSCPGGMVYVYKESRRVLQYLKSHTQGGSNAAGKQWRGELYMEKFLRSCPSLKIKFGSG